jgi:hypothetical protein
MSWTLPTPLLLLAGVVALLPLLAIARRPTRALAEAFGIPKEGIAFERDLV